jgi:hypothetical protein
MFQHILPGKPHDVEPFPEAYFHIKGLYSLMAGRLMIRSHNYDLPKIIWYPAILHNFNIYVTKFRRSKIKQIPKKFSLEFLSP